MWWRKLDEVENEYTSHNFSLFAIFLPKLSKLVDIWQSSDKTILQSFFETQCIINSSSCRTRGDDTSYLKTGLHRRRNGGDDRTTLVAPAILKQRRREYLFVPAIFSHISTIISVAAGCLNSEYWLTDWFAQYYCIAFLHVLIDTGYIIDRDAINRHATR